MYGDAFVDGQIAILKTMGIPLSEAAWQAAILCIGWPYVFGDRGQECTPKHRQAAYNSHPDCTTIKTKCQVLNGKKDTCSGCKWYPDGVRVRCYDCRGFTYWVLLQIYGWELQGVGATSQWNTESNWIAKGTIDTIPENQLVCLFYPKKDEPAKMAHTGFGYQGQTIECSNGVEYYQKRAAKWTHWGLPVCVGNDTPSPVPPGPKPGTAIVTGKNVALRYGPTTKAGIMKRLPTGTIVNIAEPPEGWEYVEYNGLKGYMMKQYIDEGT